MGDDTFDYATQLDALRQAMGTGRIRQRPNAMPGVQALGGAPGPSFIPPQTPAPPSASQGPMGREQMFDMIDQMEQKRGMTLRDQMRAK